jgi:hypothetical protein
METIIYNIDSQNRNTTHYPNSNNFTYSETSTGNTTPFVEKNVTEMKITSMELSNTTHFITADRGNNTFTYGGTTKTVADGSYTRTELIVQLNTHVGSEFSYSSTTGKVTITYSATAIVFPANTVDTDYNALGTILGFALATTYSSTTIATNVMKLPQETYFFLKINNLGNITYKNRKYFTKLYVDYGQRVVSDDELNRGAQIRHIQSDIIFNQPTDINGLQISVRDKFDNLLELNGSDFSFTLEITVISNSILKNYNEMFTFSETVMQRMLNAKMLSWYEKELNETQPTTLATNYNSNMVTLNNQQEYNPAGNRMNYNYDGFIKNN